MATTYLEGWTEEEYRKWAESHPEEARTQDRSRILSDQVRMNFDSSPKIVGYAARFNIEAELWPGFKERIAPGAFRRSLENKDDVRALWNHNPEKLLGRTKSGTLTLREDENGLWYEILKPDTQTADEVVTLIKRGDISQSSFGFNIVEQTLAHDKTKDIVTRTLKEVRLFDVSPVTFPAYESTEVHVRTKIGEASEREVIVADAPVTPEQSDEELLKRFAAMKETGYGL
jgi:uncharacterized protein